MSDISASPQRANAFNALGRFVFWFSLIAAAIAVYYFFLIERGSEHVYRRDFRSLTQIERQINSGFDRFAQVASTQTLADSDGKNNARTKERQIGRRSYPLQTGTDIASGECAALTNTSLPAAALFTVRTLGGNALIDLCVRATKGSGYAFAQRIPLADFINASEALEKFHQVLVFDGARNLIYRSGDDASDLLKANVYDLLGQNVTTHEALVALPDSWLREDDDKKSNKLGKAAEANDNSSASLIPFSKVRKFTIGEQEYLAFVRPMKLDYATLTQPGETPTWYVVGITTTSEFNASRFVVPRWWMAIFLLALALFVLSTPYLKLRLLGPRDLIRASTVTLTVISMLFTVMITTIMLLNLSSYLLTENNIREQLHSSSQLLAKAFATELDTKKAALKKIASQGPISNNTQLSNAQPSNKQLDPIQSSDIEFIRASVFDSNANLMAIWSREGFLKSGGFSVKNRKFWQQLEQHSSLPVDKSDLTYSLDNILNRIDGKKMTICAMRVAKPSSEITNKPGWTVVDECKDDNGIASCDKNFSVVTGLFNFNIFSRALLPKGYGFIVIDNASGTVQYHAEAGADLIEHLYEETDNNPALKTAINTGSPDTFLTNYRGHRYLFHTRPLAYSQWTLVTYFSQEFLDRVNLDLLLSAAGLSVGFLMLYMGAGLLGFKFLSLSKINLLWPNPGQTQGYRLLFILLSALTLTMLAAIACLHADRLFSVVAMAPITALSGAYICLVQRYQPFQALIATQSLLSYAKPQPTHIVAKDWIVLGIAAGLILCALFWANSNWPWQLLPYTTSWAAKFLAHGSGLLNALLLLIAAYFTLILGLRSQKMSNRNAAADHRRALLQLLMLLSSLVLMANLPLIAAICIAAVLIAVLAQPLWRRDSSAENRQRCKLYLPIDRRSDRGSAYTLHRLCITMMIAVLVVLPAVAFYRDATSLYFLRWSQQDAQKFRAQIEHAMQRANVGVEQVPCDLACRFKQVVRENENYGLLISDSPKDADGHIPVFTAAPKLIWQSRREAFNESESAENRLMRPINEMSRSMSRISGFSKIENDVADDAQFSTWQVINDSDGQHLLGALKFSYADQWLKLYWPAYFDFGLLSQYRLWILLALALFAAVIIYPMVRLILRELVAEADLRPYPSLTTTELNLLFKNNRSTLLLVSGNSLDKSTLTSAELESETVSMLEQQLVHSADASSPLRIAALPDDLTGDHLAPDIMVVAEQRWHTFTINKSLHNTVRTQAHDANPPTWEALLESINKLRYPDDVPDLALGHWHPDRTCTLLICRNIEAQSTLAAYAAQSGWQPQTLGNEINGDKIWLHSIEEIIFEPTLRKQLLDILENLQTHRASRSIVLTGLILPHLWFTERASWRGEELDVRELARWLAVLTRINVRTVSTLAIEQYLCEIHRSNHALPRPSREAEYALWWQYSTHDERTALAALTHEGLINPYNRGVIRSLMARGLIFRGSTLRFSDKGFKLFVKHKYPITQLRRQADIELQQSSWGAARGPLLIALAIFGYGVMVMGGGAFETALGLATSIGASIPALLNLAKLVKKDAAAT
jgi:hypothetical protein